MPPHCRTLMKVAAGMMWLLLGSVAQAWADASSDINSLMVVLRESEGANKQDESLVPMGKMRVMAADGTPIEIESAMFEFLGDMHIRFVFDGETSMRVLSVEEFDKLELAPDEALALAVTNVKKTYGEPAAVPFDGGVLQILGESPDFDSSYFLDRDLWSRLLQQHPGGLVVAVPSRGGLLCAPVADIAAVAILQDSIHRWYSEAGRLRVSSRLYLFKDGRWSIYQASH